MTRPWNLESDQAAWWGVAIMLGAVLAFIVYSFIGTFVFGIFIYYATRPVYRRLKRVVRPPSLAAGVALIALALPALLLLGYTIAVALQELTRFIRVQGLETTRIETLLGPYIDVSGLVSDPFTILSYPNTWEGIQRTIQEAGTYLGFLGLGALHLFVIIIIAFYLLRDDHRLASWVRDNFADSEGIAVEYARRVDRDFSHIFFGNLLNALLTGIIGATSYGILSLITPSTLSLPYPALLGLLTGVASLVPVVGIKLVYVPLAGYLLYGTFGLPELLWFPIIFVIVSFVIVDVIPDLVLRPILSGDATHVGLLMLAYTLGPIVLGFYGFFFAPIVLVVGLMFATVALPRLLGVDPDEEDGLDGDQMRLGDF